jgi:hypothetical protein
MSLFGERSCGLFELEVEEGKHVNFVVVLLKGLSILQLHPALPECLPSAYSPVIRILS